MRNSLCAFVAAGLLAVGRELVLGQDGEELKIGDYCSYYGELIRDEIYGFPPDDDAKEAVQTLLRRAGSLGKFDLYSANVPNAVATMIGKRQAILYNPAFIEKVKDGRQKDWIALGIFAHEMAHHTQGHLLAEQSKRRQRENDADYYSGFLLYQLGASQEQAQAAVNKIASEQGSSTHPPKSARLAAVVSGWKTAASVTREIKDVSPVDDNSKKTKEKELLVASPVPRPSIVLQPSEQDPTPNLVAAITINNTRCFLTSAGLIVTAQVGSRPATTYGRQMPSNDPRWVAWILETPTGWYWVDYNGVIVGTDPRTGQRVRVGQVSSL